MGAITFSVFTKPWKGLSGAELGRLMQSLGVSEIEFPVRPGFQVEPEAVEADLPKLAQTLADFGIRIGSVAGPTTEAAFAACAAVGVPIIRVGFTVTADGYLASEAQAKRELERLVPLCERYGVKVGVQNHSGRYVPPNAMGLRSLLADLPARHIGAILDAAHNALNGEEFELGLDIVWSHLCMVNLKNAIWQRTNGPEAPLATWKTYWTSGPQGLASWPKVAAALKKRNYQGPICLTAEYSAPDDVNRLIAEDLAFARSLFAD